MYVCSPCSQGCRICSSPVECENCFEGYAMEVTLGLSASSVCIACPTNCKQCSTQNDVSVCSECMQGATLLTSTNECFVCGSTTATQGCQTCNNTQCTQCLPGLVLGENGCEAEEIESQGKQALWIGILVVLCLICTALIGLLIYGHVQKGKKGGLYEQIK